MAGDILWDPAWSAGRRSGVSATAVAPTASAETAGPVHDDNPAQRRQRSATG